MQTRSQLHAGSSTTSVCAAVSRCGWQPARGHSDHALAGHQFRALGQRDRCLAECADVPRPRRRQYTVTVDHAPAGPLSVSAVGSCRFVLCEGLYVLGTAHLPKSFPSAPVPRKSRQPDACLVGMGRHVYAKVPCSREPCSVDKSMGFQAPERHAARSGLTWAVFIPGRWPGRGAAGAAILADGGCKRYKGVRASEGETQDMWRPRRPLVETCCSLISSGWRQASPSGGLRLVVALHPTSSLALVALDGTHRGHAFTNGIITQRAGGIHNNN